jgi:hypothetical protein
VAIGGMERGLGHAVYSVADPCIPHHPQPGSAGLALDALGAGAALMRRSPSLAGYVECLSEPGGWLSEIDPDRRLLGRRP